MCARVNYINIVRLKEGYRWTGEFLMEYYIDPREDFLDDYLNTTESILGKPADIGMKVHYNSESGVLPHIILRDAIETLHLSHITHLRLTSDIEYQEIRVAVECLLALQVIVVIRQAIEHLVNVLNDLQDDREAKACTLYLQQLKEIRLSRDETGGDGYRCWFRCIYNGTWRGLRQFLQNRQAQKSEIESLHIELCRYMHQNMVEELRKLVGCLEWDGLCLEKCREYLDDY